MAHNTHFCYALHFFCGMEFFSNGCLMFDDRWRGFVTRAGICVGLISDSFLTFRSKVECGALYVKKLAIAAGSNDICFGPFILSVPIHTYHPNPNAGCHGFNSNKRVAGNGLTSSKEHR